MSLFRIECFRVDNSDDSPQLKTILIIGSTTVLYLNFLLSLSVFKISKNNACHKTNKQTKISSTVFFEKEKRVWISTTQDYPQWVCQSQLPLREQGPFSPKKDSEAKLLSLHTRSLLKDQSILIWTVSIFTLKLFNMLSNITGLYILVKCLKIYILKQYHLLPLAYATVHLITFIRMLSNLALLKNLKTISL